MKANFMFIHENTDAIINVSYTFFTPAIDIVELKLVSASVLTESILYIHIYLM